MFVIHFEIPQFKRWTDEHLKWDPKNYANLTTIHFAAHEIWQPDLSVYNK